MPISGGRPAPRHRRRTFHGISWPISGIAVLLFAIAAEASDHHRHAPKPVVSFESAEAAQHAQNHPECTCRAHGNSFQLGMQICMNSQIFRCSMDLNVTSWKSVGSPCPQS